MGLQKALVALFGGAVIIANELGGASIGMDAATGTWINSLAAVLTPVLVYTLKNK